jgi:hypothetical protein
LLFVNGCELQEPLFGSLKQHLGGCRLHGNGEVEMVVREWLPITRAIVWVLKQHLGGCQLRGNEEVEMVVREWLRITRARYLPQREF